MARTQQTQQDNGGISHGPGLSEEQAKAIFDKGQEAVVFALMQPAAMTREQTGGKGDHPAMPSGMKPVYEKPTVKQRRRRKPGRKTWHAGARHATPKRIDQRKDHRAKRCPDCSGRLKRCQETRTRYTEDIPGYVEAEVTEHAIHRDFCPKCRKMVEPVVLDALPRATFGNRVNSQTRWLWCFGDSDSTFCMIDRSRGSPAIQEFFTEHFDGLLVTDFWGVYDAVSCASHPMCFAHLLREFATVEKYKESGDDWLDAIRLGRRHEELSEETYVSRRARIDHRLGQLIDTAWTNHEACRLLKRLRRHRGGLFTFLEKPWLPFDTNHAERSIHPAVIMRNSSYCNRSAAPTRSLFLRSIFWTLKQRNHHRTRTVTEALATYPTTGQLPPFPPPKKNSIK